MTFRKHQTNVRGPLGPEEVELGPRTIHLVSRALAIAIDVLQREANREHAGIDLLDMKRMFDALADVEDVGEGENAAIYQKSARVEVDRLAEPER